MNERQIKTHINALIEEYASEAKKQSVEASACNTVMDRDYHHWLAVIAAAQAKALKRLRDEIEQPNEEM